MYVLSLSVPSSSVCALSYRCFQDHIIFIEILSKLRCFKINFQNHLSQVRVKDKHMGLSEPAIGMVELDDYEISTGQIMLAVSVGILITGIIIISKSHIKKYLVNKNQAIYERTIYKIFSRIKTKSEMISNYLLNYIKKILPVIQ